MVHARGLTVIGCGLGALLASFAAGMAQNKDVTVSGQEWGACRGSGDPVRWIAPAREVDRHALQDRCRTVGPPALFAPARAGSVGRVDSLVVVSWNIHVGGGNVIDFVARLRSGHWTQGATIEHFVLLLQEVHRTGDQVPEWQPGFETPDHIGTAPADGAGILDTARGLGLYAFYAPSMRNGGADDPREDRGNAILSTLPLTEHTVIELPFEGQRRAAVAATVRGISERDRAWMLRLCSVHLDAQSRGLRLFSSLGAGRLRQARFLVQALADAPTVLAGDFNTWTTGPREAAISIIRNSFPLPELLTDGSTFKRRLLYDPRVDYMFFRLTPQDQVSYRRLEQRFDSDHNPLMATIPVVNLTP